jgi:hypothetical protein
MENNLFTKQISWLAYCLFIFLMGCSKVSGSLDAPTPTPPIIPPLHAPTNFSESMPSVALPTQTPSPSSPLLPSSTHVSTSVPFPTVSAEQATLVFDLLENNKGCDLPCWWGITPGETSGEGALAFLETFASRISDYLPLETTENVFVETYFFGLPENQFPAYLGIDIFIHDGIVQRIEPYGFSGISTYHLGQFLQKNGPPDEIWLSVARRRHLTLVLFYPEDGILAAYSTLQENLIINEIIRECLPYSPSLLLWKAESRLSFHEAASDYLDLESFPYLPFEEATEWDVSSFYQTYTDANTEPCIETPASLWPEQGRDFSSYQHHLSRRE